MEKNKKVNDSSKDFFLNDFTRWILEGCLSMLNTSIYLIPMRLKADPKTHVVGTRLGGVYTNFKDKSWQSKPAEIPILCKKFMFL